MKDHYNTLNIVCPWCEYENEDSWELNGGREVEEVKIICNSCSKEFLYSRILTIDYRTRIEQEICPHEDSEIHFNDPMKKYIFSCDQCEAFETFDTELEAKHFKERR